MCAITILQTRGDVEIPRLRDCKFGNAKNLLLFPHQITEARSSIQTVLKPTPVSIRNQLLQGLLRLLQRAMTVDIQIILLMNLARRLIANGLAVTTQSLTVPPISMPHRRQTPDGPTLLILNSKKFPYPFRSLPLATAERQVDQAH